MLKRIRPHQAVLGMYVHGFAGSWLAHPFWRSRFVISSPADLERVRSGGVDIVIDTTKGAAIPSERRAEPRASPLRSSQTPTDQASSRAWARNAVVPASGRVARPAFGRADKARATGLARKAAQVVRALFEDVSLGRSVATGQILDVVQEIVDLLEQNRAAFISVIRLKAKDDPTYAHSVAVCALMINLARETGATQAEMRDLGLAGLLHDIGKVEVDTTILQKEGRLTDDERAQVLRHPEAGYALLAREGGLPAVVLDACLHHHERLDGSGYPYGLYGDGLTPVARMAAICDVYDAMTSDRSYKKAKTPLHAIEELEGMAGQFDSALLFRFMRSVGVYPAGKLVRLRSNRLAVALPPVGKDHLPMVRAFYRTIGNSFIDYEDVVLGSSLADDQAIEEESASTWFSADWSTMAASIVAGQRIDVAN